MHCYFPEYDPQANYIRQEMVEMITGQRQLLSLFAQASGQKRCALGLDFEDYDPSDGSVPVYLLGKEEVDALSLVEGKKLRKAFRASRVGKNLVVTFNALVGRGWFRMRFDLGEQGVDWQAFPSTTAPG